ncbi:hypothetical protein J6590_034544 [Homalodisca vitripennis]|nr:hypothetical protein J6590_034544 [Homalodisca vitripennis]
MLKAEDTRAATPTHDACWKAAVGPLGQTTVHHAHGKCGMISLQSKDSLVIHFAPFRLSRLPLLGMCFRLAWRSERRVEHRVAGRVNDCRCPDVLAALPAASLAHSLVPLAPRHRSLLGYTRIT